VTDDQTRQQDPKEQYPKPQFPEQEQEHPGLDSEMQPEPDYGYETYRGHGRLEGKAAIEKQYGPLPAAFTGMRFPLRRLVATDEPGVVLAEFDGSIGLKEGGRYDNRYVGVFAFNPDGKLARYTEYFDPYTLIHGFPGAAEAAMPAP